MTILQGDCGEGVLDNILGRVWKACLFWLDGHQSEEITVMGTVDTLIFGYLIADPVGAKR